VEEEKKMSVDENEERLRLKRMETVLMGSSLTINDVQTLVGDRADGIVGLINEIARNSGPARFYTNGQLTRATAGEVQFPKFTMTKGVIVKALGGNAGMVYVGAPGVLNAGGPGIGGFELDAGQAVILPLRLLEDLWLYDAAGGQIVCYFAM